MDSLALIPGNFYHIYNREIMDKIFSLRMKIIFFFLIDTTDIFRPFVKHKAGSFKNHFHILIYVKKIMKILI